MLQNVGTRITKLNKNLQDTIVARTKNGVEPVIQITEKEPCNQQNE